MLLRKYLGWRFAEKVPLEAVIISKGLCDEFNMDNAKPVSTPLASHFRLSTAQCSKSDEEIQAMSKVPYASAVGCLMYAIVCTRLDLAHAVTQSTSTWPIQTESIGRQSNGFSDT